VHDIDLGTIHVFPKLDGTNASVWLDSEGVVQCGSRKRVLSEEKDNAGFWAWVNSSCESAIKLRMLVQTMPQAVIYGEWLVPHSLKTYRDDAWRRFWIFDVYSHAGEKYVPFDDYGPAFEELGLDVIHPLVTAENPSANQLAEMLQRNSFLVQDNAGIGEGIVIKNYLWKNKHGRQPWAKIVSNEFKAANSKAFGPAHVKGERDVCAEIVAELATEDFVRKEFAKVVWDVARDEETELLADNIDVDKVPGGRRPMENWTPFIIRLRHKVIPRFLGTVFYTLVTEEIKVILKKWKNPTVDFSRLNKLLTLRCKEVLTEVF
jgi:hypothetical protein